MKARWNRNVVLNLLIEAFDGVASSIWSETMLVAFLSDLTNGNNKKIGLITALQGDQLLTC